MGDVFNRGKAGAGRGLTYLSSGSIVLVSEATETVELVLVLRGLVLAKLSGTCKTFTSWPGRSGQEVVDGSDELWNSRSWSSL